MTNLKNVRIAGTGMYVPPHVVTNSDLEKLMETSDEWIRQRSGIEERRHVRNGESPSDLALLAARQALQAANMSATDMDLIIVATLSPEHFFPGTSVFLQEKLGLDTTPAMDVRCQCSGFLYGLATARAMIASGMYRRVLLVGAEVHSPVLDMSTRGRDIAVLFGDGAGAVVLEASDNDQSRILDIRLHAEGRHAEKLWLKRPGSQGKNWVDHEDIDNGDIFPKMEGRYVYKHAVSRLQELLTATLQDHKLQITDIKQYLFHQANLRINEHVAAAMGIPMDRVPSNIQRYGNCSAASIPILMDECARQGRLQQGDLVYMSAFGSGFTWGSCLLQW